MSTAAILAIVIPALVILGAVVLFTTSRRRDADRLGVLSAETRRKDSAVTITSTNAGAGREVERSVALARRESSQEVATRDTAALEQWTPPDPEVIGVSRRQFFNRSMIGLTTFGTAAFGASAIAFLWPQVRGGFGSTITVGSIDDVVAAIDGDQPAPGFAYYPNARAYVTKYPAEAIEAARAVYPGSLIGGMEPLPGRDFGFIASWQKCPHLGCRVPQCATSQWFECPCHGSQYNRVGEWKAGPAPRGLDHFPVAVSADGMVSIDTGSVIFGMVNGTDTTGQGLDGPHCVTGGGH